MWAFYLNQPYLDRAAKSALADLKKTTPTKPASTFQL